MIILKISLAIIFITSFYLYMRMKEREYRLKYPIDIGTTNYPQFHEYSHQKGSYNIH